MRTLSRALALAGLVAGAFGCWNSTGLAADWPYRTVRLIAPGPVGGGLDFTARLFAERLSQRWRQAVIVENRPGADGVIGVSAFLGSSDDHTLLFAISATVTVHAIVNDKLPYDPVRDLVPISSASDIVLAIAASEKNSIRSLADLVQTARAQPGKLNWASSPGLPLFVVGGFLKNAGLDLASVSYREITPALQDLGEGRIDVFVTALTAIMPLVQASRARLLAVASRERVPTAPEVPTAIEAGFPELTMHGFVGFYGKRGMPDALRDRIAADVRAIASDPGISGRLAGVGQAARSGTSAEFAALLQDQRGRLADLAKTMGIKTTH
jgi:tripartite-type tricarboxylate transporter receptor subunit TctC